MHDVRTIAIDDRDACQSVSHAALRGFVAQNG